MSREIIPDLIYDIPSNDTVSFLERKKLNLLAKAGLFGGALALAAGAATARPNKAAAHTYSRADARTYIPSEHSGKPKNPVPKPRPSTRRQLSDPPFIAATLEDLGNTADTVLAQQAMQEAKNAGFNAITETVRWGPGVSHPKPEELQQLQVSIEAAKNNGLQVILRIIPDWNPTADNLHMPLRSADQRQFVNYTVEYARDLPDVSIFQIANEVNTQFYWQPQFNPDGSAAAPIAYEHLLARLYEPLKQMGEARGNPITIVAGELAAGGTDDPKAKKLSISPTTFIKKMGDAYRASGRAAPIFDQFSFHTYPKNNTDPPDMIYDDGTVTLTSVDIIRKSLKQAFEFPGSGQSANVPLFDTETGYDTAVKPGKPYYGSETVTPIPVATQANYYSKIIKLAYCQGLVGVTFLHTRDESDLKAWQSGEYDPTGTPKPSLGPIRASLLAAQNNEISC